MPPISSRRHPMVRRYRALAAGRGDASDAVLVEGLKLLEEAVAAGAAVLHVAMAAELAGRDADAAVGMVRQLSARGVHVDTVSRDVLDAMSPARSPSGLVAMVARPLSDCQRALNAQSALVLALIDVQDPGNVGAAIRSAEAGGATGVVMAGASADPFGWKALRGAMGSAFRLPVAVSREPKRTVESARAAGLRVAATAPRGGVGLDRAALAPPLLVCLGGEGPGLDESLVGAADVIVTIPMRPPVESLNVAVSAALIVYTAAGRLLPGRRHP